MTTIATDGKSMAGDSLTTAGSEAVRFAPKVFRAADGRIIGGCGDTVDCVRYERWVREGGDQPTFGDEWCALILNRDGTVDWIDKNMIPIRYGLPAAVGSGAEYAIGAMLAGLSPEKAVEISAQRDVKTGGAITVEAL